MSFRRSSPSPARGGVLICGPSPDALGGGPTHIRALLSSDLPRRFHVDFFQTGSRGRESPACDEPLPAKVWRLVWGPISLGMRITRVHPAVVHLNTSLDARGFWRELTLLAVAKLLRRRVVYQIHGGTVDAFAPDNPMRAIARLVFGIPDAMAVLGSIQRKQLEALGSVRRTEVVFNAIEVEEFAGSSPRVHSGRIRRLGYLGRLVDGKGLEQAVDAVAALRREPGFEDLELRLAGSGEERDRIAAHAESRGVADAVTFVGTVAGRQKVEFLRHIDVLVLPSRSEGLPYSVLEAMAAGTPVVASGVGGIPDALRHHRDGLIVLPEDAESLAAALRELARDPAALRAMSAAAADRAAADFDLERLADRFGSIYRELGAAMVTLDRPAPQSVTG